MNESTSLFIFAHQDDESGVFCELHRLVSRGDNVIIVYLTSGNSSGGPSSIRDCESILVLTKLGIQKKNIYFLGAELGIPDGSLSKHMTSAFQAMMVLLNKTTLPESVYFLAWEGGHQDHDAVHIIGLAIGRQLDILEQCFQFPLYTGFRLTSILFSVFSPIPENGKAQLSYIPWKLRFKFIGYCLSYPSQKKTWLGLFLFFLFHYIFKGTQILQPVSHTRITQKPHSGSLLYERRGVYTYREFADDSSEILNKYIF